MVQCWKTIKKKGRKARTINLDSAHITTSRQWHARMSCKEPGGTAVSLHRTEVTTWGCLLLLLQLQPSHLFKVNHEEWEINQHFASRILSKKGKADNFQINKDHVQGLYSHAVKNSWKRVFTILSKLCKQEGKGNNCCAQVFQLLAQL